MKNKKRSARRSNERRRRGRRRDSRLDERIEQLVRVNDGLSVVGHQTDDGGIPFLKTSRTRKKMSARSRVEAKQEREERENRTHVDDLGESGRSRGHENLTNSVVKLLDSLV